MQHLYAQRTVIPFLVINLCIVILPTGPGEPVFLSCPDLSGRTFKAPQGSLLHSQWQSPEDSNWRLVVCSSVLESWHSCALPQPRRALSVPQVSWVLETPFLPPCLFSPHLHHAAAFYMPVPCLPRPGGVRPLGPPGDLTVRTASESCGSAHLCDPESICACSTDDGGNSNTAACLLCDRYGHQLLYT